MKHMIAVAERDRKNQKLLVEKMDKAAMAEVIGVLTAINIGSKYR